MGFWDKLLGGSVPTESERATFISELSAGWFSDQQHAIPDSQAGYIRQGFHGNPWLYSVVSGLAQATAALPYYFAQDIDGEESRIEGAGLRKIADLKKLLERPNLNQTGQEFFYELYSSIAVSPVVYIFKQKDERGRPFGLWILREQDVAPIWLNEQLKIARGYHISIPGLIRSGSIASPDEVIVIRNTDLTKISTSGGTSPVRAAREILERSNTAISSAKTMTANMGAIGIAVLTDPNAEPEDAKTVESLYQQKYQGAGNVGKIVFTNGDMKYLPVGHPIREMMFPDADVQAIRAFCGLYNLPSQLFGDVAGSTYSNYKEARRAMYTNSVIPLFKKVHEILSWRLYPDFPGLMDIFTAPDVRQVPELQADLGEQANAVDRLIRCGTITPAEARVLLGYGESADPMSELLYQQSLAPLSSFDLGENGEMDS